MGKILETEIAGRKYLLNTDEEASYIDQISAAVTSKIFEIKNSGGVSPLDCAVMAALSFADELYKERAKRKKAAPPR
jgi:cell division protein ZapA (FtsZ GTPase activity inhibitor)